MLVLKKHIEIKGTVFENVSSVTVSSSYDEFTDTAHITMARPRSRDKRNLYNSAASLFSKGDPVTVTMWYQGYEQKERFSGYVTGIKENASNVEVTCQDGMYVLKNTVVQKKHFSAPKLSEIIAWAVPSTVKTETEDITFGPFTVNGSTVAELLNYLKDTFGICSFFRDGVLNVGFPYKIGSIAQVDETKLKEFKFGVNILSDSLESVKETDTKYRIEATSVLSDNTTIKAVSGDNDGEIKYLHYHGFGQQSLEKIVTEKLSRAKYTGFKGSFRTFLSPYVKHGEAVKITDPFDNDRSGIYLIKSVVQTVDMNGAYQDIYLETKMS